MYTGSWLHNQLESASGGEIICQGKVTWQGDDAAATTTNCRLPVMCHLIITASQIFVMHGVSNVRVSSFNLTPEVCKQSSINRYVTVGFNSDKQEKDGRRRKGE